MEAKAEDFAPTESAIRRAQAGFVKTREKAIALQAELQAVIIGHGELVGRAAAGEDVPEEEWRASEDNAARLGRLAARYTAILKLQACVVEAVKAVAGKIAGAEVQ